MIVYTANYGGKDRYSDPPVFDSWNKDLKFVYFTDHKFESDVWDVVVEKKTGNSNRLAKWYKINSHELFPDDETVWLDASIGIRQDPTRFFEGWNNILLRKHPKWDDLYEEALACFQGDRDSDKIRRQLISYKGFPADSGLFINGILFRKPTADTTALNKLWWEHICNFSYRDQISLPFVLYESGIDYNVVDTNHFGECFTAPARHTFRGSKEI